MTVANLVATVEGLTGHPLNSDEGVHIGPQDREVNRAVVCWMATPAALRAAERSGAQLVVTHESPFYPYNSRLKPGATQEWQAWQTNRQRIEIAERAGLTVLRVHGSADEICVFDDFAALVGLGAPVAGEGTRKVYEIEPVALGDLVARVKKAVGMEHVRAACGESGLSKTVRRIGLPWGGLGLFVNVGYQQWAIANGCDALIAGESDSYGFRFCTECDVPMIETSHEASETPGMRHFAGILAERHPGVHFEFHDNGPSWQWL